MNSISTWIDRATPLMNRVTSLMKNRAFIILTMLAFFKPRVVVDSRLFFIIYTGLAVFSAFIALIALLKMYIQKELRPNLGEIFIILFVGWTAIATFLGGQGLSNFPSAVSAGVFVVLTGYYLRYHCGPFLQAMTWFMGVLIGANIVSMIVFPQGFGTDATRNPIYFWNTTKHLVTLYLSASVVSVLSSLYHYKKITWRCYAFLAVILLNIFAVWTATAIAGMVCFYCFVLFFFLTGVRKPLPVLKNFFIYFLLFMALNVGITVFRIQDYFSLIIEGFLNKSLTFTGRTVIWDSALAIIKDNFWLGVGERTAIYHAGLDVFLTAHNHILIIWIQSGLVGVLFYVGILLSTGREINRNIQTRSALILLAAVNAMMLMFIAENLSPAQPSYLILMLAFFIPQIESEIDKGKPAESRPLKGVWGRLRNR